MGALCSNDPEASQNKDVQRDLAKDQSKEKFVKKLLFLGAGGSGKSTLFKQLRSIHGSGWTKEDRLTFVDHIHAQIIEQMKLALDCIETEALDALIEENADDPDYKAPELKDIDALAQFPPQSQQAVVTLRSVKDPKLTTAVADACKTLWAEQAVRDIYAQRAQMGLEDSSAYFWDKIDTVVAGGYVPDAEDILLVRYRTTGVIDQKFAIKKNVFHVFDVGGQKSERKKWIHCFDSVTAVIFVASLSCYDEVMFEDEQKNSMVDSVELFDKICNNDWFKDTAMILFLNKKDLFAEKLKTSSIRQCPSFSGYTGEPQSYDHTTEFIKEVFEECNRAHSSRNVFTHLTCAVDKNQVEKVFNDIQTVIINASLAQGGLIA